jgi:hypothetical protein
MVALGLLGLGVSCIFDPFVPGAVGAKDSADDTASAEECVDGSKRCLENILEECEGGAWLYVFDCTANDTGGYGGWCEEDGSSAYCSN